MKVVFSSTFKQDLLAEESRYASISSRLGEDFHERVKATIHTVIRWQGGTTSDRMVFRAGGAGPSPIWFTTPSRVTCCKSSAWCMSVGTLIISVSGSKRAVSSAPVATALTPRSAAL